MISKVRAVWFWLAGGFGVVLVLQMIYEMVNRAAKTFGWGHPKGPISSQNWQEYIAESLVGIFSLTFLTLGVFAIGESPTPSRNVPPNPSPNLYFPPVGVINSVPTSPLPEDSVPQTPRYQSDIYPDEMEDLGPCDGWGDCSYVDDFTPYWNGQEYVNSPSDEWGDGQ